MKMKRIKLWLMLLFGLFSTIVWIVRESPRQRTREELFYRVSSVYDGDTVSVNINGKPEKIRLIGIDAPEMGQRPWGLKSKKHIEGLLGQANWNVFAEYDIQKRDRYGRLLCYLWAEDKKMINLRMLEEGYAQILTVPPNVRYSERFREAQRNARIKRLGIWAGKGLAENPGSYREKHRRPYK